MTLFSIPCCLSLAAILDLVPEVKFGLLSVWRGTFIYPSTYSQVLITSFQQSNLVIALPTTTRPPSPPPSPLPALAHHSCDSTRLLYPEGLHNLEHIHDTLRLAALNGGHSCAEDT